MSAINPESDKVTETEPPTDLRPTDIKETVQKIFAGISTPSTTSSISIQATVIQSKNTPTISDLVNSLKKSFSSVNTSAENVQVLKKNLATLKKGILDLSEAFNQKTTTPRTDPIKLFKKTHFTLLKKYNDRKTEFEELGEDKGDLKKAFLDFTEDTSLIEAIENIEKKLNSSSAKTSKLPYTKASIPSEVHKVDNTLQEEGTPSEKMDILIQDLETLVTSNPTPIDAIAKKLKELSELIQEKNDDLKPNLEDLKEKLFVILNKSQNPQAFFKDENTKEILNKIRETLEIKKPLGLLLNRKGLKKLQIDEKPSDEYIEGFKPSDSEKESILKETILFAKEDSNLKDTLKILSSNEENSFFIDKIIVDLKNQDDSLLSALKKEGLYEIIFQHFQGPKTLETFDQVYDTFIEKKPRKVLDCFHVIKSKEDRLTILKKYLPGICEQLKIPTNESDSYQLIREFLANESDPEFQEFIQQEPLLVLIHITEINYIEELKTLVEISKNYESIIDSGIFDTIVPGIYLNPKRFISAFFSEDKKDEIKNFIESYKSKLLKSVSGKNPLGQSQSKALLELKKCLIEYDLDEQKVDEILLNHVCFRLTNQQKAFPSSDLEDIYSIIEEQIISIPRQKTHPKRHQKRNWVSKVCEIITNKLYPPLAPDNPPETILDLSHFQKATQPRGSFTSEITATTAESENSFSDSSSEYIEGSESEDESFPDTEIAKGDLKTQLEEILKAIPSMDKVGFFGENSPKELEKPSEK